MSQKSKNDDKQIADDATIDTPVIYKRQYSAEYFQAQDKREEERKFAEFLEVCNALSKNELIEVTMRLWKIERAYEKISAKEKEAIRYLADKYAEHREQLREEKSQKSKAGKNSAAKRAKKSAATDIEIEEWARAEMKDYSVPPKRIAKKASERFKITELRARTALQRKDVLPPRKARKK